MTERIHIRVTRKGDEAVRKLIVDRYDWGDISFLETVDLIEQATESIKYGKGVETVLTFTRREIRLTFIEAIEFVMQATSSLRW